MTGRRIRAALIDLGLLASWGWLVGVLLPVVAAALRTLQLNLLGGLLVVVPATVVLTLTEGGRYEASPGKQWLALRVRRTDGSPLGYPRALLRNTAKVALPWAIGHVAWLVVSASPGSFGPDVWVLVAVAVLVPLSYVVSIVVGERRTPYDMLSGSRVVPLLSGRRVA